MRIGPGKRNDGRGRLHNARPTPDQAAWSDLDRGLLARVWVVSQSRSIVGSWFSPGIRPDAFLKYGIDKNNVTFMKDQTKNKTEMNNVQRYIFSFATISTI